MTNYPMKFINVYEDGSYTGHQRKSDAGFEATVNERDGLGLVCAVDLQKATENMLLNNETRDK